MEHIRIAPPAGAAPLPPEMLDTFAHHGLRELLFAPIPKVARALAGFDRDQLGTAIEVMIAMLDAADRDPDAEIEDAAGETIPVIDDPEVPPAEDDSDPDLEETELEDSFVTHGANGPGCPISDVGGGAVDDEGEPDDDAQGDTSWTEWHTRGRSKDNPGVFTKEERQCDEDFEEDDPSGQCDEDGINTAFHRRRIASGPGCVISDVDYCTAGEDRIVGGAAGPSGLVCDENEPGDSTDQEITYPEWHTLPLQDRRRGSFTGSTLPGDLYCLGYADDAEDSDRDACLAADDIGTNHKATRKIGWDSALGNEDLELNGDEGDHSR